MALGGKTEIVPDRCGGFIGIAEEAFCFLRFFAQDPVRQRFPGLLFKAR